MLQRLSAPAIEPVSDVRDRKSGVAAAARRLFRRKPTALEIEDASPVTGSILVWLVTASLVMFVVWAHLATVEEVTRAEGRVIPSSTTQIIQASEPGVVIEIAARLGQQVRRGDVLMRLDPTASAANLGEFAAQERVLKVQIARLQAEYEQGREARFTCPDDVASVAAVLCENEANLLRVRHQNLEVRVQSLLERVSQRRYELTEARSMLETASESLRIAESEYELRRPLAARNIVPRTEMLQLERDINGLRGQVSTAREAIPRIEAAIREAELQVSEQELLYRQEALSEMNSKAAQLSVVSETIRGAQDRVSRTSIRSPVDGIVNAVHVNTQGAFVQPGARIMDVVPLGDTLLVEARVRPADIAFLRPDQKATVKVTAYDFSIYGGLEGRVVNISADSVLDEQTREPFFIVLVATDRAYLEQGDRRHPILPGMITQVDILTGEKSILDYLLKPINKARQEALRER